MANCMRTFILKLCAREMANCMRTRNGKLYAHAKWHNTRNGILPIMKNRQRNYFRHRVGLKRSSTVKISKRPTSIISALTHFAKAGKLAYDPTGAKLPIHTPTSPRALMAVPTAKSNGRPVAQKIIIPRRIINK